MPRWGGNAPAIDTEASLDTVLIPYGLSVAGPVRLASGLDLAQALSKTSKNAVRDIAYSAARPLVPETASSVARMAGVDGTTRKAWFDPALGVIG